jgi:hypothetical protein
MGNMSVNKLGGLSLILGPIVSVISFLVRPGGGIIGGSVDPADSAASIGVLLQNSGSAGISFLLLSIGLIVMLFGLSVLVNNLKDGEGLAVGRIGLLFVLLATAGWLAALALTLTIAGGSVPAVATQSVGAIYAAGLGINVLSSILAAIGFTFVILGLLASAKYNKNVTLLVLVLQLVTLVTSVMAGNDLSFLQTASMIAGGAYVVTVIYLANIGRSMLNEG